MAHARGTRRDRRMQEAIVMTAAIAVLIDRWILPR